MRAGVAMLVQGAGGGAPPATTWNPSDKSSLITLSGGNLTATFAGNGAWGSVRATTSKTAGKWYFEVYVSAIGGGKVDSFVGLMNGADSVSDFCGKGSGGYGYYALNGNKYNNNSPVAYGGAYTVADVIGVAYDPVGGKVWFAKNNTWQASGDPAAGTNPAFSGIPAGLFAAVSEVWNGHVFVGRFAAGSQTYSPPSGFTAWG